MLVPRTKLDRGTRTSCPSCITLVGQEEAVCRRCRSPRPAEGWPAGETVDQWIGQTVAGAYWVEARLGSGATAAVYRARSLRLQRDFAVKFVDVSALDGAFRWKREVEALCRLSSPYSVRIVDVAELPRHVAIVMEYVEGMNLREKVLADGPIDPLLALKLIEQIATGLAEAHDAGVVHRDLKPSNIMTFQVACGFTFTKIVDFGLATNDEDPSRTIGFVGTPDFAAPEQFDSRQVDGRTDLFALGGVLYFLTTGRHPFGSIPARQQFHRRQTSTEEAARPSAVRDELRDYPGLDRLVLRLLARDPAERPQSATDLLQELCALREVWQARGPSVPGPEDNSRTSGESVLCGVQVPIPEAELGSTDTHTFVVENGRNVTTVGPEGAIRTVSFLAEARDPDFEISSVDARDGSCLVGTSHGAIGFWAGGKRPFRRVFETAKRTQITDVSIGYDGAVLAGAESGRLYLGGSDGRVWRPISSGAPVLSVAAASRAGVAAGLRRDGTVEVFVTQRTARRRFEMIQKGGERVELTPDGAVMLLSDRLGTRAYDTWNGSELSSARRGER